MPANGLELMRRGAINAIGVFLASFSFALIMSTADPGAQLSPLTILAWTFFVLVFVLWAVGVGILMIGMPAYLLFAGFKKEALALLLYTMSGVLSIAVLILIVYVLVKTAG